MTDYLSLITSPILAASTSAANSALVSFTIYLGLVFLLAALANRAQSGKKFVSEYFVGSKNIGLWAFALTYAATAASGGSFMGFPAYIYSHGWSLAWWICGYMVVPLVALGLFAKRINQVGRIAGAITVPELMRRRFASSAVGNTATLLVVFFMFFYLLAQFKAGAQIMATLLDEVPVFQNAVIGVEKLTGGIFWIGQADGDYLLCLIVFAVAVIIYTAYGGFRAVVWTDVMQGIVMGIGVIVMLVLTLSQVGGLGNATRQLAEMTPPEFGYALIELEAPPPENLSIRKAEWLATETGDIVRLKDNTEVPAGETRSVYATEILRITTPAEIEKLQSQAREAAVAIVLEGFVQLEPTETVPGEFEFAAGTVFSNGEEGLISIDEIASIKEGKPSSEPVPFTSVEVETDAEITVNELATARVLDLKPYAYGAGQKGVYVTAPGPSKESPVGFLTVALAISFFVFWNFSGAGQPSYMVRQMAFNNTVTLRRSIMLVALYFSLIYFPLVIIFTCGRVLMPGMEIFPDRAMPEMATFITTAAGVPWLAGLLVAAPFAAVMSSVDSFLLLVSSGVVRDIYQENINPNASEARLKKLSHWVTIIVGSLAVLAVLNPPEFLQTLIVFASAGLGACFLMPIVLSLYWPRMTASAAVFGMVTGGATILGLYITGSVVNGSFSEYNLFGVHPFIWSVIVTSTVIVVTSLMEKEPDKTLVEKYFGI